MIRRRKCKRFPCLSPPAKTRKNPLYPKKFRRSYGQIKPEWQKLKVRDFVRSPHKIRLGGKLDDTTRWFVVTLEPNRALVLRDESEHVRDDQAMNSGRKFLNFSVFEPAHSILERKTLLTFKQTAEEFGSDKLEKRKPQLLEQAVGA